jgi:hypothetical protein
VAKSLTRIAMATVEQSGFADYIASDGRSGAYETA